MRTYSRFSRLLLLLFLVGLLPVATPEPRITASQEVTPQAAPAEALPPGFACYGGANPPLGVLCLVVPVTNADGSPADDAVVSGSVAGQSFSQPVEQLPNEPVDQVAAAIDVGQLGAQPGDTIAIEVETDLYRQSLYVGLAPDPTSRTHITAPVALGADSANNGQLWGTVYTLDDRIPLEGATVRLYRDDVVIGEAATETADADQPPLYSINGLDDIPLGTQLELEATYAEQQQSVRITWDGQPLEVPIVLGWGCVFAGPRNGGGGGLPRNGGGGGLPIDFCLTGRVTYNGEPVEGVDVSLEVPDKAPLLTTTGTLPDELQPVFAANIGDLLNETAGSTNEVIRIIAVSGELVGTLTLPIAELQVGERWGQTVSIPLRSERMGAFGLEGGTPRPIAMGRGANELNTYVGLPAGGGIVVQFGVASAWTRMLGAVDNLLPSPDVTALYIITSTDDGDTLLAGTRTGEVLLSSDSARGWTAIPLPDALGPIAAFTARSDTAILIAGRDGMALLTLNVEGVWEAGASLPEPPFTPTALATLNDGTILAGAIDGLYRSVDAGATWTQASTEPVTALAVAEGGAQPILIGTPGGLQRAAAPDGPWSATTLNAPILGLAISGTTLRATTPDGIVETTVRNGALDWEEITGSDTNATLQPTVGTPDILDLAIIPDQERSLVAATSTGVYQSINGGLSWNLLPGWPENTPARSVAALSADTLIALTHEQAYRWDGVTWSSIAGLPTPLNGSIVRSRVDADTTLVLIGRKNARGPSLYASVDSAETWTALNVGSDRGVTALAFYATEREGYAALIGSDGDGIFGWSPASPATIGALPPLNDPDGRVARVSALTINDSPDTCAIYVGTTGPSAGISSRACAGAWSPLQALAAPTGTNVGAITSIVPQSSELLIATSEGIFQGIPGGGWTRIFGLALRPLTLVIPPTYAEDRLLIAGGPQSGAVLLSNVTADIRVDAVCLESMPGGSTGQCEVSLVNQGLLPTNPGTLTVTLNLNTQPDIAAFIDGTQTVTFTVDALRASEIVTYPLEIAVALDARPGLAILRAEMPDPTERFTANNLDEELIYLAYRPGADPAVIVSGQTTALPGQERRVRIRVPNLGDQELVSGQLQLTLPPGVEVRTASPGATQVNGNTRTWNLPRMAAGAVFEISLLYRMPATAVESTPLPISATLINLSDDRELENNASNAFLRVPPSNPEGIVLTNWSRLSTFGSVDAAKAALTEFLPLVGGVELALDDDPPCPSGNGASVACAYQAWDNAVAALAAEARAQNRPAQVAQLAANVIRLRQQLVTRITQRIRDQSPPDLDAPAFLYIVGGDSVIPADAYIDASVIGQSIYPEKLHAATLAPEDPLYSVLLGSHYPSYATYDRISGRTYDVGVQTGTPTQIAQAIKTHNDLGGQITLDRANIAGYAKDLTADIQQRVCADLQAMGKPLVQDCTAIERYVSSGLPELAAGAALQLLSDHSDQWNMGDLSSLQLQESPPPVNSVNVLLLLGCHTGLAPQPEPYSDPSLVDVLSGQGQPAFGYTGYAYAGADNPKLPITQFQPIYAERLHQLLTARLFSSSNRLGALRRQAIADFGMNTLGMTDLRRKTVETLTLYGPPTYRVTSASGALAPSPVLANLPATVAAGAALNLGLTYTPVPTDAGTFFDLASSTAGTPFQQSELGRTTQPGLEVELPADVSGAFITGGTYQDIPGIDPVIRRVAPLNDFGIYSEPRYTGPLRDWAKPLVTYTDGDERRRLVVVLGQWTPLAATQRLFNTLDLELVGPTNTAALPPQPHQRPLIRRAGTGMSIEIRGGARIVRVELVLYEGGQVKVFPLNRQGSVWKGVIPLDGSAQFLIQALGTNGEVLFDTNNEKLYDTPGDPVPAPEFAACPAGWEELARYEGRLRSTGPTTLEQRFTLDRPARVALVGYAQEGHPEVGCPGNPECEQGQAHESFQAAVAGRTIGVYRDTGPDVNAWVPAGPWATRELLNPGSHTVRFTHLQEGSGPQSVIYRMTMCVRPDPTP